MGVQVCRHGVQHLDMGEGLSAVRGGLQAHRHKKKIFTVENCNHSAPPKKKISFAIPH